jgi:hypothetical protein
MRWVGRPLPSFEQERDTDRRKPAPRGHRGAGGYRVRVIYFFSSSPIAALALSVASEEFPALHAASASLTRVEAFLNSAERGA